MMICSLTVSDTALVCIVSLTNRWHLIWRTEYSISSKLNHFADISRILRCPTRFWFKLSPPLLTLYITPFDLLSLKSFSYTQLAQSSNFRDVVGLCLFARVDCLLISLSAHAVTVYLTPHSIVSIPGLLLFVPYANRFTFKQGLLVQSDFTYFKVLVSL